MTAEAGPLPDGAPVGDLVMRARDGDQRAWDAIVERYAPLVWSICRRYRLAGADADDAGQVVWRQMVDHIGQIRDPAALPGWLAATTGRECGRIVRAARGTRPSGCRVRNAGEISDEQAAPADEELLLAAVREALAALPPVCQRLLTLLAGDPPLPYAQVSARLGIPADGIGPARSRCLAKLRRHPAIAALTNAEPVNVTTEPPTKP